MSLNVAPSIPMLPRPKISFSMWGEGEETPPIRVRECVGVFWRSRA